MYPFKVYIGKPGMMNSREERRRTMLLCVTRYLDAMCAGTPDALPLAPNVCATYNGAVCEPGRNELWDHAVRVPSRQTFSDPETDNVVFFGVVTNDMANRPTRMGGDKLHHSRWYLYMLRLKLDGEQITEIEELTCDQPTHGDHPISQAQVPQLIYEVPLPAEERLSREEMMKMVDDYWLACAKEIDPVAVMCHPDAFRWEQGQPATDTARFPHSLRSEFAVERFHWQMPRAERRYPVVDPERGMLVSLTVMRSTGPCRGAIVWEVFKFEHGLIKCVHGFNRALVEHSGWAQT